VGGGGIPALGIFIKSNQYSLGYYPQRATAKGQVRKIKISVNRSNVAVRAKDSYTSSPTEAGSDKQPNK
jgi:hypothetical protein